MDDEATNEGGGAEGAASQFSEAELASIAKGQEGIDNSAPAPVENSSETPQRPDHIPEKFWKDGQVDVDGLANSYAELERARSAPKDEPAARPDGKVSKEKPAGEGEGAETPSEGGENAPKPLDSAIELARTQFAETQELGEDAYKALEEAGIPPEITDLYIKGLQAQAQADLAALHGYVGGKENYEEAVAWAANNLDDAAIDSFNEALDNPKFRELAVKDLYSKFSAARPNEGKLVAPSGNSSSGGDVFSSMSELSKAQSDPRYGTDAAYRQEVTEKLQRSLASGVSLVDAPAFQRKVLSY